jgi:predicted porin
MPIWFNTCNFPKTEVGSGKTRAPIQTLENLEMKKTLVALAALASVSAFAQSTVAITGAVDVSYGVKSITSGTGTNLGKASGIAEGQNTANRINFNIEENLGGGMKAGAMFETGMNVTNGALLSSRAAAGGLNVVNAGSASAEIPTGSYSTGTNRQSYVKLSGSFGEVRAGYQYTNLYQVSTLSGYMVGQEQFGSLVHTIGNATFGGTRANGITYIAPKFGAFTATVQVGAAGDREDYTTDTAAGVNGVKEAAFKRNGIKIDYAQGALNASYARTNVSATTVLGTAATAADALNIFGAAASTTAPAAAAYTGSLDQLGASYTIGALKLAGTYNSGKKDNATGDDVTYKSNNIGGIYTVGAAGFFASTGKGEVKTGASTMTNDIKQSQYGVRYALSKRTTAYVMHGESKDAQTAADKVAKATVTAFGLAHSF